MNTKSRLGYLTIALICFLFVANIAAIEYEDYKRVRLEIEFFTISYDKHQVRITTYENDETYTEIYLRQDLKARDGYIYAGKNILFDDKVLNRGGKQYYYDSITDSRISSVDDSVSIVFYTRKPSTSRVSRFKGGNLVSVGKPVRVESEDFVRGVVLAVGSSVEIYGEVNRDIIALLGDVSVAPDAVARGDIAAIGGEIDVAKEASVYGEIYDVEKRNIRRQHRFIRGFDHWALREKLTYDRVDGLGLYLGVKFSEPDSVLPSFALRLGYAFNSDRWRYKLDVEQTLLHEPDLMVGGSFYRRLANEDGWLLGDDENTVFALLATEDFRDYYEAEGGLLFVKSVPMRDLTVETGFRLEETNWLDARRHLWSLFGGNKLFSENFSTVEDEFRIVGIEEIDSTTNGSIYGRVAWDTRSEEDPFDFSAWHLTADLEWSHDNFGSDFDYRRYTLGVRRYQEVNRHAMVIGRVVFGGSDGYLPMYKRFFLGGLGTLRGYDHKEYPGTRFWLANTEYRINFPRVEIAASVFWDIGQIANDSKLDGTVDIKNNLGLAIYFEDDFRISLAKRLDRSYDDNPVFYVRLDHIF